MTAAIMQPTYLPWAGYFNLIARSQKFVLLNDVQFAKPSWQMRNRILLQGRVKFITVPTLGSRNQPICEVRLATEDWRSKHRKLLEHAYAKHPHGAAALDVVLPIIADRSIDKLQDLNARLIAALCEALSIEATLLWSSQLAPEGQRSARLLSILRQLGELDYLSPPGAAEYIAEDALLQAAGVRVRYQHFEPHAYPQRGAQQFEARLSIIDVIANLGLLGARSYLSQAPAPSTPAEPEAHPNRPETPGPALRA
jgi:hypothetical protein